MQGNRHSVTVRKRKSELSHAQQQMVELFQQINFGKLHRLQVRSGEPQLIPLPRVVRDVRIPGENGSRLETHLKDFVLKREMIDFFDHLKELDNGEIELVEVRYGLPVRLLIESIFQS